MCVCVHVCVCGVCMRGVCMRGVCMSVCSLVCPNSYLQLKLVQLCFGRIWQGKLLDGHLPVPFSLVHLAHITLPDQLLKLQLLVRDLPFAEDASSLLQRRKKTKQVNFIKPSIKHSYKCRQICTLSAQTALTPLTLLDTIAAQEVVLEEPLHIGVHNRKNPPC